MRDLDELKAIVSADVEARKREMPLEELKEHCRKAPSVKDIHQLLDATIGGVSIIGEIKRASPSIGHIREIADVAALASEYESGGAGAISAVTAQIGYEGSLNDLDAVRSATQIPILRKDFIFTSYQIHESRAHGADMVLLISSFLEENALESLIERTHSLGMTALVECRSRLEARQAVAAGAKAIGINARNFFSFEVDMTSLEQVIDVIPGNISVIAEAGVRSPHDVFEYARVGADAVMVGESLMRSHAPGDLMKEMVAAGAHPALRMDRRSRFRAHHES